MKRLLACTVLIMIALGLLAAPVTAAAVATANLVVGQKTSSGPDRPFSIEVTASTGIGEALINTVRVNFPINEAGVGVGRAPIVAPPGWTATATRLSGVHFITYRGGVLVPGVPTTFSFPGDVAVTTTARSGDFRVQVSVDDFQTSANAPGALITTVTP